MNDGSRDENRAFQGVSDLVSQPPCYGRQEIVPRGHGFAAGIEKGEAARSVRALHVPAPETGVAEKGGLLVARAAGYGNGPAEQSGFRLSERPRRGHDFRKHGLRNIEDLQQLLVPDAGSNVVQHGPRRVRRIGAVPAGELVQQPGIDGPEKYLAPFGARPQAGKLPEKPHELRSRKIRIQHESRLVPHRVRQSERGQFAADVRGTAALPDDGIVDGLAAVLFPYDHGLALVRDPDRRDLVGGDLRLGYRVERRGVLGLPDLVGIVFHPAGFRIDLPERLLRDADDGSGFIEYDRAGRRGSLIKRENIAFQCGHAVPPSRKYSIESSERAKNGDCGSSRLVV